MRIKILLLLLLISAPVCLNSQELKIASALMSSGGTSQSNTLVSLPRWGLIKVDKLILKSAEDNIITKGAVTPYPNPVVDQLSLKFSIPEKGDYEIVIVDVLGQKLMSQKQKDVNPGDIVRLDLSSYAKGMYLVKVISHAENTSETLKIQK